MGIILCTLSHVLHASEKFALCLAAAGLVTCLVFTITMMLVLGIGLGYNYCFVDFKTRHRYIPGYYKYTILPATRTYPRRIQYYPPYPTIYRLPQNEWHQFFERRVNVDNDTIDSIAYNDTSFDNLNISLAIPSSDILNKKRYNASLPIANEKYEDINKINISNVETSTRETLEKSADKISNYSKTVLRVNGLDLLALLTKLRSENKNYTVRIETD